MGRPDKITFNACKSLHYARQESTILLRCERFFCFCSASMPSSSSDFSDAEDNGSVHTSQKTKSKRRPPAPLDSWCSYVSALHHVLIVVSVDRPWADLGRWFHGLSLALRQKPGDGLDPLTSNAPIVASFKNV